MLLTLSDMRNRLLRRVPGTHPDAADDAINEAYNNLARMYPWEELETEFRITTKAYVATGGADFNSGTTSITAATSVSAAWSGSYVGMFIKKDDDAAYYTITASTSIAITITESYTGKSTTAAASSGDSYVIFKHIYTVPSGVETVERLMHDSYLHPMTADEFERCDPDLDESGEPKSWRMAGANSAGVSLIQIYPARIDDVYELRGRGRKRVETLTSSTTPLIDSLLIIAFAEVDLLQRKRMLDPRAIDDTSIAMAVKRANNMFDIAVQSDMRRGTVSNYVADHFYNPSRGHQWYVEHDPFDA